MSYLRDLPRHAGTRCLVASLAVVVTLWACGGSGALSPALPIGGQAAGYRPDAAKYYPVKPSTAGLVDITSGPDRALWFTEELADQIGRITTSGKVSYYKIPTANASPRDITVGPDQALWFTEYSGSRIGRVTTSGHMTEYKISVVPSAITVGPDKALWFTGLTNTAEYIGRITTTGSVKEYKIKRKGRPEASNGIVTGPDGALWFTTYLFKGVGRMTTSGKVQFYKDNRGNTGQTPITSYGGRLWVGDSQGVSEVTTSGHFTEYEDLPGYESGAAGITRGPNNGIWWLVSNSSDYMGTLASSKVKEYTITVGTGSDVGLAFGSDKALWFLDPDNNRIGRFTP